MSLSFEDVNSFQLLHGGKYPDYRPKCIRVETGGPYALQLVSGGGLSLTIDGWEHYTCEDGLWVFATAPDRSFDYSPLPEYGYWHHRYLSFLGSRVDLWHHRGLLMPWPQKLSPDKDWEGMFDELLRLKDSPSKLDHWVAGAKLEYFLLLLAKERIAHQNPPDWFDAVTMALEETPEVNPDYAQLAASVHMSLRNLHRRFQDYTGVTLHAYFLDVKMRRARALLGDRSLPLKVVAETLGYRDVYYFSRQFRKLCGMPPGEFRKSLPE